jgi:hypothetical protein
LRALLRCAGVVGGTLPRTPARGIEIGRLLALRRGPVRLVHLSSAKTARVINNLRKLGAASGFSSAYS